MLADDRGIPAAVVGSERED